MKMEHHNKRQFNAPLPELLEKFYPVTEIWPLYQEVFYSQRALVPEKKPKKEEMIAALLDTLTSPEKGTLFFQNLNKDLLMAFSRLTWVDAVPLLELEKQLGFQISDLTIRKARSHYDRNTHEVTRREAFFLVVFQKDDDYYSYSEILTKKQFSVLLPPALRSCFKKLLPPPQGYDMEPVAQLPVNGLKTFRCDETLVEDLRVVADYISRGHLQYTNAEKIKKPCIRALSDLMQGGEFFPNEKSSLKLPLLRVELFVNMIASIGNSLRNHMLSEPPDPKKILRGFLDEIFKNPELIHEYVLPHLVGSKHDVTYDEETMENLEFIFSEIDTEGWITFENLQKYQFYREIELDFFIYHRCHVTAKSRENDSYYRYSNKVALCSETKRHFLTLPLLQGTAFLLAAFGMVEIAYERPTHPCWERSSESFLTPFDGLVAIRLTPLGSYALGITNEIELKVSKRKRAEITLNPQRLTVTCRNIDPVTELSLLEFMEKLSDGCYRMTRKSFMRGCASDVDIKKRIEQFKANISATPPPFWQAFLDDLSKGAVALRFRGKYKVYELTDTPELRQLFSSDPVLREKTLKVEGLKVAFAKEDLLAINRRLADLGYLVQ